MTRLLLIADPGEPDDPDITFVTMCLNCGTVLTTRTVRIDEDADIAANLDAARALAHKCGNQGDQ